MSHSKILSYCFGAYLLLLAICFLTGTIAFAEESGLKAGEEISSEFLLKQPGVEAGLVVLVEPKSPQLAVELASTGKHVVLVLQRDYKTVLLFDEAFVKAGVHGAADAKIWLEPKRGLPLRSRSVNAVIGDPSGEIDAKEIDRVLAPGYGVGYRWNGTAWTEHRVARPKGMDIWTGGRHTDPSGHYGSEDTEIVPPNTAHFITGPNNMRAADNISLVNVNERIAFMGMHSQDAFSGVTLQNVGFIDAMDAFVHDGEIYDWRVVGRDGKVRVTNMRSGKERWINVGIKPGKSVGAGSWSRAKRFRHDGELLFMSDGSKKLYAFNLKSGEAAWVKAFDHHVDLIATDGKTLAVTLVKDQSFPHVMTFGWGQNEARAVVSVDRKTGEELWRNTSMTGLPVLHLAVEYGAVVSGGFVFPPTLKGVGSTARRQANHMRSRMHIEVIEPDSGQTRWIRKRFEEYYQFGGGGAYVNNDLAMIDGYAIIQTDEDAIFFDLKTGETHRRLTGGVWKHTYTNAVTPNYYFFANRPKTIDGSGHVSDDLSKWRGVDYYTGYRVANGMLYGEGVNSTNDPRNAYTGFMALSKQKVSPVFDDSKRLIVSGEASAYAAPDSSQWYTFRGSSNRGAWINAKAPTQLALSWKKQIAVPSLPNEKSPLLIGWQANSELPGVISQPTSNGKLVLVSVPDAHRLDAIEIESGKLAWSTLLQGRADTAPTIAGGVGYVCTNDGMITAIDLKNGATIWQFFAGIATDYLLSHDQIESLYYVPSAPILLNGTLYATAGRHSSLEHGVMLWGLDPVTGAVRHKMALNQHTLAGNTVYSTKTGFGFTNDTLQVVDGALRINDLHFLPESNQIQRKDLYWTKHFHVFPTFNTGIKQGGFGWIRPVTQWRGYGSSPREFASVATAIVQHPDHMAIFSKQEMRRIKLEEVGKKGNHKKKGTAVAHKLPRFPNTEAEVYAVASAGDITYAAYREGEKNIAGENIVLMCIFEDGSTERVAVPVLNKREEVIPDGIAIVKDKVIITTTLGRVLAFQGAKLVGEPRVEHANEIKNVVTAVEKNQAVVASDDAVETNQNVPVIVRMLDNDRDPEGKKVRLGAVVDKPANGTLKREKSKGSFLGFKYYPNKDFTGTDTFTYSVGDGDGPGTVATAKVTITVKPAGNAAPIAKDDGVVIYLDQSRVANIGVTLNDKDPNPMDHLNVTSVSTPSSGIAKIQFNTVVYTPKEGYVGKDSFTYTISDPSGASSTATVNVQVIEKMPQKRRGK